MSNDSRLALVVGDDPELRSVADAALEAAGFDVIVAEDGIAGIEAVIAFEPSLILMDVELPRMSGFEACAAIREMPRFGDTPILMTAALDDDASIDRAYECGATDLFPKPLSLPLLRHRIRYVVRAASVRVDLRVSEAKNRAFVRAIPDSLLLVRRDGVLTSMHRGQKGRSFLEGGLAKGDNVLAAVPDDVSARWTEQIRKVLTDNETETLEFSVKADDKERFFESRIIPYLRDRVLIIIRDITERKIAMTRVHRLAFFDTLTDLPNRQSFKDHLSEAIGRARKTGTRLGVIYIDLDNFKRINDSLGHSVGDQLLKRIAERLGFCVRRDPFAGQHGRRAGDIRLARLGGDEFTVTLSNVVDPREVELVAERVRQALGERLDYDDHNFVVTPSIGIAIYPDHGTDVDTLVRSADVAMYRAKARGGDNQCPFSSTMSLGPLEQLNLEGALRNSLTNGDLELHYQPKISLGTGRVCGFEALTRWDHPELGPIAPSRFIPVAEQAGLILELSDWVLDEACRQLKHWESGPAAGIPVAVNLSGMQFNRGDVFEVVTRRVSHFELPAGMLQLELTESMLMEESSKTAEVLRQLKLAGFTLAIDDFGTGYSSLSYLKRFPIDFLKIDRSFVADLVTSHGDQSICSAVIALAHALGLEVVAEGVETDDQLDALRALGCDEIQGHLIAEPLPADRVIDYLIGSRMQKRDGTTGRGGAVV